MSKPTTRTEFKFWCLRRLGYPVININIDRQQVEDRIDEAIEYWKSYHHLASERIFLKHELTQTDIDRKYIEVPEHIIGISQILDPGMQMGSGKGDSAFTNVRYQFMMSEVFNLTSSAVIPSASYFMAMRHVESINYIFGPQFSFRFNQHSGIVYIDTDWSQRSAGNMLVFDCYRALDPTTVSALWKDWWLQRYACALLERQWAMNVSPFTEIALLNNVRLDGASMLARAEEKISKLEEEVVHKFSLPPIPRIA